MKLKIALVGAGSREFGPATLRDILLSDTLAVEDLEVTLMDLNEKSLHAVETYARELARVLGRRVTLSSTTDLDEALGSAAFVVTAIEIRRYFYWAQDFHVPRLHGFRQIYGENGGPGGLFHALRNMGPTLDVARAMQRRCPDAWLLNYTNPLTKLCEAATRLSTIRTVGLCHGVFHAKKQLSEILGVPLGDIEAYASGLNHFTWFESIRHRVTGEDLYPRLREREREAQWLGQWDEIALSRILLRTFGLYPSPGANHIGEYIRWAEEFLGSSVLQFFYDPVDGHPWDTGRVPTWIYNLHEGFVDRELFPEPDARPLVLRVDPDRIEPSGELAIPIIEGIFCGKETELAAINVPNEGQVPGVPLGSVVETPATVGLDGLRPRQMAALPEGVLALIRRQTSINALLVDAFESGSRAKLLQALLLEPTTQSYRSAVALLNKMCDLQADVLPPFAW